VCSMNRARYLAKIIFALGAIWPSQPVFADDIVIGGGSAFGMGERISGDTMLKLGGGCDYILIWNGSTFSELVGPYSGPLNAYKRPKNSGCVTTADDSGERETVYDFFFHQVCETQNRCDKVCGAVFQRVSNKGSMKLKCP
jgi:hypothetical protein